MAVACHPIKAEGPHRTMSPFRPRSWHPGPWSCFRPQSRAGRRVGSLPRRSVAAEMLRLGPQPGARPAARGRSRKVVRLAPFGVQLAESLDDHAVDFLKVIDVLRLGRQPSRHVVHPVPGLNFETENKLHRTGPRHVPWDSGQVPCSSSPHGRPRASGGGCRGLGSPPGEAPLQPPGARQPARPWAAPHRFRLRRHGRERVSE